jgi:cephalosporin-C deacetylase
MPLDQLQTYAGRNPKPADFDERWDLSLQELSAIDADVVRTLADFIQDVADCYHLFFTGTGGARVHAKLLVPKQWKTPCPAALHFHGYTMRSGEFSDYLGLVGNGFVVAALDCRGQAGQSEDIVVTTGPTQSGHIIRGINDSFEKMYFRNVFLDAAQLAGIVMSMAEVDEKRVGAFGGSQGGGLTLACAALEPRIARAAPAYPFLSDYQRVWEMDLDVAAYDEIRKYFRHFDPLHKREQEVFTKLGYIDIQHLMPRVSAEVMMAVALMDTITPPSTCFAAFNKIKSQKRTVIYPDYGHEGLPGWNDMTFEFLHGLKS